MQLASGWADLRLAIGKTAPEAVLDLSLDAALKLIAKPKPKPEPDDGMVVQSVTSACGRPLYHRADDGTYWTGAPGDPNSKLIDNTDDDTAAADDGVDIGGVADSGQVLINALDAISNHKAVAEACRKVFKLSTFDSEQKAQIGTAIDRLIAKWKIVKSTLDKNQPRRCPLTGEARVPWMILPRK